MSSDSRDKLTAADFPAIVEKLVQDANPETYPFEGDWEDASPSPLSSECLEDTVAELTRIRTAPGPRSRSKWLRPAALIPLGVCVALLASAPAYVFIWDGVNGQEDLSFENAIEIATDVNYTPNMRLGAVFKISSSITRGVRYLRRATEKYPSMKSTTDGIIREILRMADGVALTRPPQPLRDGFAQDVLDDMEQANGPIPPAVLASFLLFCEAGIAKIHETEVKQEILEILKRRITKR